jgi:hypothetical protein
MSKNVIDDIFLSQSTADTIAIYYFTDKAGSWEKLLICRREEI